MQKVKYRYQVGDILCLRHGTPLMPAGDYVLRVVDDMVCLSRLVQTLRGRRLSRKQIYMLITDLCLFQETGRRYHATAPLPAIAPSCHVEQLKVLTATR